MSVGRRNYIKPPEWILPLQAKLGIAEAPAIVLAALLEKPGRVTRTTIADAISRAGSTSSVGTTSFIGVQICRLRTVLTREIGGGVEIETHRDGFETSYTIYRRQLLLDAIAAIPPLPADEPRHAWRLSGAQEITARALLKSELLSREGLRDALIAGGFFGASENPDVHIMRLRRKLAAFALTIETVTRKGWRFDEASRRELGLIGPKVAAL